MESVNRLVHPSIHRSTHPSMHPHLCIHFGELVVAVSLSVVEWIVQRARLGDRPRFDYDFVSSS